VWIVKRETRIAKRSGRLAARLPRRRPDPVLGAEAGRVTLRTARQLGRARTEPLPPLSPSPATTRESILLTDLQDSIVALVARWGYERQEEAFTLSAGFRTHDYIDGKKAIAVTSRLRTVAAAFLALAAEEGVEFDAVGGLTMGADPLALAIAVGADGDKQWFSVRKEPKEHGKQQLVEGANLLPGTRVLLVDDVVTTGRSILQALDAIEATGAHVVLASALVDRGTGTGRLLAERNIRYRPMTTYKDLGIEPVPDLGRVPA